MRIPGLSGLSLATGYEISQKSRQERCSLSQSSGNGDYARTDWCLSLGSEL
jgi:hypothetical protein